MGERNWFGRTSGGESESRADGQRREGLPGGAGFNELAVDGVRRGAGLMYVQAIRELWHLSEVLN